ncbi:hypothetical protein [Pedobacter sp. MC2016-24]|uniref:hypothetical protein n=1 Tax=Pedobacter sp. MC2016-24 TaxID=2780090 RepID=UPI00187F848D|nr:hypothetical protein [Pedobacter sp. MC2016-24]MBE9600000.1 hypothetical protein [Pedobacter sp. MC2016-24]
MKFWNGFRIFWIIYLLFFAIGLPLILHYGGDHHQSDYQMMNTSASEAFVLLGLGTTLWLIVFIYYIKQFLINPLSKKNGFNRFLQHGEKRDGTVLEEFEFLDSKPNQRSFEVGNTIGILLDREPKPPYIEIDGQVLKWNTKTMALNVIGLILLIAFAAGILVYTYINESHGYGWRYLYFWHPYVIIPGIFIFNIGLFFDITKALFSKYLGKFSKPDMLLFGKQPKL